MLFFQGVRKKYFLTEALPDFPVFSPCLTPHTSENMSGAPCSQGGAFPQLETFCEPNQVEIIHLWVIQGLCQVLLGCTVMAGLIPSDVSS